MMHLLKIEWMKVKNYKAFWIFTVLYIFAILGINYTGFYINELAVQNSGLGAFIKNYYAFPLVWQTVGFMSSWLLYFPGILFIMLLSNEFNFKTHRQNIIDGWNRWQFITVKFVFVLVFSAVATLFNVMVAFLFGSITTGSSFSMEGMENIGYIFIQTVCYINFAMFLAVLFRRSGAAIAVFFLFGLIFEFLITILINVKLKLTPVGYFFPLQTSDIMLPNPFLNEVVYPGAPPIYALVIGSLAWVGLYYFFALRKFQHDDL